MGDMTIRPLEGKVFGATVGGVDLRKLSDDEFAAIHAAFLEHGFLLFPGQHLDEAESADFGRRWGELEFGGQPIANQRKHRDGTYGEIFDVDAQVMRTNVGNEAWHTDSTYKPLSSKCAMLAAVVVPDEGGQTELADMRSAFAELDQATMTGSPASAPTTRRSTPRPTTSATSPSRMARASTAPCTTARRTCGRW